MFLKYSSHQQLQTGRGEPSGEPAEDSGIRGDVSDGGDTFRSVPFPPGVDVSSGGIAIASGGGIDPSVLEQAIQQLLERIEALKRDRVSLGFHTVALCFY